MTITRGDSIKNIIIYPPAKPRLPTIKIHKHPYAYWEKKICPPLTLVEALEFKDQTEDDVIDNFMSQPPTYGNLKFQMLKTVLEDEVQEDPLTEFEDRYITTNTVCNIIPIEIEPGNILNINGNLDGDQKQRLIKFLQKHQGAFAWDYPDMKGMDPQLCTHHIYTDKETRPI